MRLRHLTAALLAGVSLLALSACSIKLGGDESADKTTTTEETTRSTLAEPDVTDTTERPGNGGSFSGDFDFTADEYDCMQAELDGALPNGVATGPDDLASLSPDQLDALASAMDLCATSETAAAIADLLADSVASELDGVTFDSDTRACFAESLDGQVGQVFVPATATEDYTSLFAVMDPCISVDQMKVFLTAAFESAGATPDQALCAADIMAPSLSMGRLAEIGGSEEPPADLAPLVERVQTECL